MASHGELLALASLLLGSPVPCRLRLYRAKVRVRYSIAAHAGCFLYDSQQVVACALWALKPGQACLCDHVDGIYMLQIAYMRAMDAPCEIARAAEVIRVRW